MSPENIETVRVLLDAWGRGDGERAPAQMSEDVEFDASARLTGGRIASVTVSVDRAGALAGLGLSG